MPTGCCHDPRSRRDRRYVLGDPKADAFVSGGVLSSRFINERPDVARRYAAAWLKAIKDIQKIPRARASTC